jgi:hypothetical protein
MRSESKIFFCADLGAAVRTGLRQRAGIICQRNVRFLRRFYTLVPVTPMSSSDDESPGITNELKRVHEEQKRSASGLQAERKRAGSMASRECRIFDTISSALFRGGCHVL